MSRLLKVTGVMLAICLGFGMVSALMQAKQSMVTNKEPATQVAMDFREFQIAFEMIARENAGFSTFGWDSGDVPDLSLISENIRIHAKN